MLNREEKRSFFADLNRHFAKIATQTVCLFCKFCLFKSIKSAGKKLSLEFSISLSGSVAAKVLCDRLDIFLFNYSDLRIARQTVVFELIMYKYIQMKI